MAIKSETRASFQGLSSARKRGWHACLQRDSKEKNHRPKNAGTNQGNQHRALPGNTQIVDSRGDSKVKKAGFTREYSKPAAPPRR